MGRYITDEEVQEQKLNQEQYEMQVYQEAIFVGLTFLPVWMLCSALQHSQILIIYTKTN
jgi:hypothetical protein